MTDLIILMAGQGGQEGQSAIPNLVIMVGMVAVLYFFMIRPQMRRAKQQREFVKENNEGDMIVTSAGFHGKIVRSNDDGTVQVEFGRNNIIKMERSAISMEMTKALRDRANSDTAKS